MTADLSPLGRRPLRALACGIGVCAAALLLAACGWRTHPAGASRDAPAVDVSVAPAVPRALVPEYFGDEYAQAQAALAVKPVKEEAAAPSF